MTFYVQPVDQNADSFGQWLDKTNKLIGAMSNSAVTVNGNTAVGNASISGTYFGLAGYLTSNVRIGTGSSNTYIDGDFVKIKNGLTSNTIYSSNGMLIDGVTAVTGSLISMGNTLISGYQISANLASFDMFRIGSPVETWFANGYIKTNQVNTSILYVTGGANNYASVGDINSNTYIDQYGLQIFADLLNVPQTNSKMTSTDLWITRVSANSVSGEYGHFTSIDVDDGFNTPTVFYANTLFLGANNQFRNGIAANGDIIIQHPEKYFVHQYGFGNQYLTNTAFMYADSDGSVRLSRNYKTVGTQFFTGTSADLLLLKNNTFKFYNWSGCTPGSNVYTYGQEIAQINNNHSYFISNVSIGQVGSSFATLTINPMDPEYGPNAYSGRHIAMKAVNGNHVWLTTEDTTTSWVMTLPANNGISGQLLATDGNGNTAWVDDYVLTPSSDLRIRSLGVGTPASGLTGEIRATNNITAYFSSDKNLKENIQPIKDALNKVDNINGVEFDWKDSYIEQRGGEDGMFVRKHDVGVIAQELEQVLPEVVVTRDDGFKAVNYEKVVALLIQAIKELKEEVDSLKANK